jgi:hypothetical protein
MESLLKLFYDVDDFCKAFLPIWDEQLMSSGQKQRQQARSLMVNEIYSRCPSKLSLDLADHLPLPA